MKKPKPPLPGSAEEPITPPPIVVMKKSTGTLRRQQTGISHRSHAYKVVKLDVWMLGITIVTGGQYFCWNVELTAGFCSYLIAFLLISSAYLTLCCCAAEITGALPFAGGTYGLSRCTLSFFSGFFIGCCETLEYITYVATTTISLADIIVKFEPSLDGYQLLIWLLFYVSALWTHIIGDRIFWRFNLVIGGISFLIVLFFCFGSLAHVDWKFNTLGDSYLAFVDDLSGFIKVLPIAVWFFVGVEALPLSSDDTEKPKSVIPVAQVACVVSLFVTGTMMLYHSHAPVSRWYQSDRCELGTGEQWICQARAPLRADSDNVVHISDICEVFGFIWCYGKVIQAMATSKLLPPVPANVSPRYGTPHIVLIAGSILGYAICLIVYLNSHIVCWVHRAEELQERQELVFQESVQNFGAVYSMSIWVLGVVSTAGFQENDQVEIMAFGLLASSLTVLYFGYSRK